MHRGYVKIWRKILDNPLFINDSDSLKLWIYLLVNAKHSGEPHTYYKYYFFCNKKITCDPGQLVTTRAKIAKETGINESKVERILKRLIFEQQIEQRTSSISRLITITNWYTYQKSEQQNEQQVNNDRTTSEQRVNNEGVKHNMYPYEENDKKEENDKNEENKDMCKNDENSETFDKARKLYPGKKRGLNTEFLCFKKHKDWKICLKQLYPAIENQIKTREEKLERNSSAWIPEWKNFSTWLNQRCWEEEKEQTIDINKIKYQKFLRGEIETL